MVWASIVVVSLSISSGGRHIVIPFVISKLRGETGLSVIQVWQKYFTAPKSVLPPPDAAVFKNNIRKAFAQALIHSLETLVVTPIAVLKIAVAHIARIWHIVDMVEIQTEHIHLCVFYHPYDMIFNPGIRFILCQIHNASNPFSGNPPLFFWL